MRWALSLRSTTAPASIAVSLITRRPAPLRKGKPSAHSPAALAASEAVTQVSGVVMRKLRVPIVMMIQSTSPTIPK